jgi:hypothetical protein
MQTSLTSSLAEKVCELLVGIMSASSVVLRPPRTRLPACGEIPSQSCPAERTARVVRRPGTKQEADECSLGTW